MPKQKVKKGEAQKSTKLKEDSKILVGTLPIMGFTASEALGLSRNRFIGWTIACVAKEPFRSQVIQYFKDVQDVHTEAAGRAVVAALRQGNEIPMTSLVEMARHAGIAGFAEELYVGLYRQAHGNQHPDDVPLKITFGEFKMNPAPGSNDEKHQKAGQWSIHKKGHKAKV